MSQVAKQAASLAEQWVPGSAAGDPVARRRLVDATLPFVHRMLWRLVGRRNEVDDLVQLVYMRAFKSLGSFRGESAFSTWLGAICINVARTKVAAHAELSSDDADAVLSVVSQSDTEDVVSAREALRHVNQALSSMSPKLREAFILHVLEGYDVPTVAAMTGTAVAATYKQLARAREQIEAFAAKHPYLRRFVERSSS